MYKDTEIDLMHLLQILWGRIYLVIALTVTGGIIAGAVTLYLIKPLYTARVSMYVYNNEARKEATINDINMSVKLVGTYIVILNSDTVLKEVADQSGLSYKPQELKNMIRASSVDNTEVFEVKVSSHSPEHACIIASTIEKIAPKEIMRVVKAGSVEIIDRAQKNPPKTFPSNAKNVLLGCLLGFLTAAAVIFIQKVLDKSIVNEKELTDIFSYPVLGSVPDFNKSRLEAYRYGR
ncbi:MAG: Wzz/FepE/Etk N-terminal domain-containing protein, partial [Bacillota bacterium]|nr:Wzz/FepE/Etk N-terminal domain-containing protein [Bacillota bacterium]